MKIRYHHGPTRVSQSKILSDIFTIEIRSSSEEDSSTPRIYPREFPNKRIREQIYSTNYAASSSIKSRQMDMHICMERHVHQGERIT